MTAFTRSGRKPKPIYHCTPQDDLYAHVLDVQGSCWCCPERDDEDPEETFFHHHAYDRREEYEEGLRKPH